MDSTKKIRKLSLLALMLAFLGGSTLMGCSSSDESSDDCACSPDAINYPDCCNTTL